MQTRTRNAAVFLAAAAVLGAGLVWVARHRREVDLRGHALDAIPNGALLVAVADLDALRTSPVGAPLLREGREIKGVGKLRDLCGFDPMDSLHEVAIAIPAAGDTGEFGLAASGAIDDEALLACAAKVIEARGGKPVVTSIGSFRSVHDDVAGGGSGEIAARKGGPLILGGGTYFRAMIDAADGRTATIRGSVAHTRLAKEIGDASVRITVVLSPEQRRAVADELLSGGDAGSPAASVVAGALGVKLGAEVDLHGVLVCDDAHACDRLATILRSSRDDRAADFATRLVGFGSVFEKLQIDPRGPTIHARVSVPADQAATLAERLMTLRSFQHPMPDQPVGRPGAPGDKLPEPNRPAPGTPSSAAPKASAQPPPSEIIAPLRPKKSPADGR